MSDNQKVQALSPVELRSRAWYYRQMANSAPASHRAREALLRLAERYKGMATEGVAPTTRPDTSVDD